MVAIAAGLRFWNLQQLGLTHFDEGSYAMAGRWLATLGAEGHPPQAAQAPALVPVLLALLFRLFGIHDYVAVALSAGAGSLLCGLLYLAGSRWSLRSVGVVAALFLATAEYHLIYSRMALTDALFTLLFWAALLALFEGYHRGCWRWMLSGGILTTLCWNSKYHGWFPLLLIGLWFLIQRRTSSGPGATSLSGLGARRSFGLAIAGGVTLLGFLPWILAVAWTTGWTEILVGLWEHSLGRGGWPRTSPQTLYFYLTRWLSAPLLGLGLAGCVICLGSWRKEGRFLIFTLFFFAGSALNYSSFPRLILPLVPGICLLAAVATERMASLFSSRLRLALLWGAGVFVLGANLTGTIDVIRLPTDSYRQAAEYLKGMPQPALSQMNKNFYFYEAAGTLEMRRFSLQELDLLEERSSNLIVAVDPLLYRLPQYLAWFEAHRDRLEQLATFPIRLYEPCYYQGFEPGSQTPPRSLAPFSEGSRIDILRFRRRD